MLTLTCFPKLLGTKSRLRFLSLVLGAAAACAPIEAQPTRIDLQTQSKNIDFSSASATKPFKTGTTVPATCSQGEAFFRLSNGTLYGCLTDNNWQPITGGGTVTSGMGAPSGVCSPGQSWYLDTTVTRGNLWYCNSSAVWLQVLDTTGTGSFLLTGQAGTAPPAPAAGYGSAWFDTASGVWKAVTGSTTSSTIVPITCGAGQFIQTVSSNGVPTCASASGPHYLQWFPAATCINSSAAATGVWQMRSDQPVTTTCNFLIDGNPEQATMQFSNSTDNFLWMQILVPANWTTGAVNLKLVTYPGTGTGDARFGVQTKCIAAGASTTGAYNSEVFAVRNQAAALNPQMTLFNSLNLTGCSAGNLLVIQLRRQNTCTGCTNGNMAAVEYFLGGSLEIQ